MLMDDILNFLELPDNTIDLIPSQFSDQINHCVNSLEDTLTDVGNSQATFENMNIEDHSRVLSVIRSEPVPFTCNFCQVLREIIHTNGIEVTKLEIHGTLGMICHGVLDQPPDHQLLEFSSKSIEDVRQFLIQYCKDRSQAGYMMIKDPLSIFYETLCVGFGWGENMYNNGNFVQRSSSNQGVLQKDPAGNNDEVEKSKPSLAVQRERTKKLTLNEIENYFHLPIDEAAKKMELSATVVKKVCRKYGVTRWPHRKIQSMEKKIASLASKLSSNDPQERARAEVEIQILQRQMAKLGKGAK